MDCLPIELIERIFSPSGFGDLTTLRRGRLLNSTYHQMLSYVYIKVALSTPFTPIEVYNYIERCSGIAFISHPPPLSGLNRTSPSLTRSYFPTNLYMRTDSGFTNYTFNLSVPYVAYDEGHLAYVQKYIRYCTPKEYNTSTTSHVEFDAINPIYGPDLITLYHLYKDRFRLCPSEVQLRDHLLTQLENRVQEWKNSSLPNNQKYGIRRDPILTLFLYTYMTVHCDLIGISPYSMTQLDLELPVQDDFRDLDWDRYSLSRDYPHAEKRRECVQSLYTVGEIEKDLPELIRIVSEYIGRPPRQRQTDEILPYLQLINSYSCFATRSMAPNPVFPLVGVDEESPDSYIPSEDYRPIPLHREIGVVLVLLPINEGIWLRPLKEFVSFPALRTTFDMETGEYASVTPCTNLDDPEGLNMIDYSHWYGIYQGVKYHIVNFDPFAYDCFVLQLYPPKSIPYEYYRFVIEKQHISGRMGMHYLFPTLDKQRMFNYIVGN